MDNDDKTIGTILSRRDALSLLARSGIGISFGMGLLSLSEAAFQEKSKRDVNLVASPALTEGPFFVDEKLNRSDLVNSSTRPSVLSGVPLLLNLKVLTLENSKFKPLQNCSFDLWHADSIGVYSDESNPMNHEDTAHQQWLRGYQVTDSSGVARFKTIIPGWYPGRTAHIHFKVRVPSDKNHEEFTSQLFFRDEFVDAIFAKAPYRPRPNRETRNATDDIYSERQSDGTSAGKHLTLNPIERPDGKGYRADFTIALTRQSFQPRREGGFGGPPPPRDDGD